MKTRVNTEKYIIQVKDDRSVHSFIKTGISLRGKGHRIAAELGISPNQLHYFFKKDKLLLDSKYRLTKSVWLKICANCKQNFLSCDPTQKYCTIKCKVKVIPKKPQSRQVKISKHSNEILRWQVLNRDNFTCQYCGRNPTQHGVILQIDHIKPKVDGGKAILDNSVTTCQQCNLCKHSRPLRHEAQFKRRLQSNNSHITAQMAFIFYKRKNIYGGSKQAQI
ncbi:hypothetical protein ES702_01919 [subsurface metagenome]